MQLATIDWVIIGVYFAITLIVGLLVSRNAGKDSSQFFLSGRNMPWWLLGFSMVATTFSTDTPNLVTDIVRSKGVAGNWMWWAFLLTGMLTVFVYARLWRRSGVLTDVEFYELRYSGGEAAFLRGFRALYLGLFFNIIIMATVTLAAIKIGGVMLGLEPWKIVLLAGTVTVIFSAAGGLRAVLITDALLFVTAMTGSVCAAYVAVNHPQVGGLSALVNNPAIQDKLFILPRLSNPDIFVAVFLIPIAVQWWSVWYPGSEPGGGGYIAQRMLAAKSEEHAVGATLFFNAAHYGLRPWPWILVALASLVVFPDLKSLHAAFPTIPENKLGEDLAYSAMLTFLHPGLLGLVVASLAAAYMSTISTQLNWGSSYVVNDFWKRFIRPEATDREQVFVGRITTALLMIISAIIALRLENALQGFNIMLQIGAGTGLIFILRWFWWRINAMSELTAMVVSFIVAFAIEFLIAPILKIFHHTVIIHNVPLFNDLTLINGGVIEDWVKLISGVSITTVAWVLATFLTEPTRDETLRRFYRLTTPGGPGWRRVVAKAAADGEPIDQPGRAWEVPMGIVCMVFGCVTVYGALFATGYWIYEETLGAVVLSIISGLAALMTFVAWRMMSARVKE